MRKLILHFLSIFLSPAVCHSQMDQITEATSILIRFLLNRLENSSTTECKILLGPLKSLCEGKSTLNVLDVTVLIAMLKNAKQPETTKSPPPNSDKDSPKSEMKRSRSDLSCVIMQQLTTPLMSGTYTWTPLNEEQKDCSVSYFFYCISIRNKCSVKFDNKAYQKIRWSRKLIVPLVQYEIF